MNHFDTIKYWDNKNCRHSYKKKRGDKGNENIQNELPEFLALFKLDVIEYFGC